ncbi:HIRAN domain-containing protein [Schleiferilactobacillus harbinensis]|uniref:HIRAN domain-containing protein n=1 Tax=Schleiferilactobacillus harbinensis TaxID=304207 RepID=UPI0039EA4919
MTNDQQSGGWLVPGDHGLTNFNQQAGELSDAIAQDVFLISMHIAGTTHVPNIDVLTERLTFGDQVTLILEQNQHDNNAVRVETMAGEKLGYLPMKDNTIIAHLLVAGLTVFGKIEKLEERGSWHYIVLGLWLHV